MPSQNSTPTTEDFELFRAVLPRLEDNQVLLAQVFAAVHDGMDVREAYEFIEQWCGYTLNWRNPFLQIPGMIEIQALQFWVALRRGWGGWKPSDACLSNVRRRLTQGSLVNHLPEERTVFEMAAPDADHVVRFEIQETGLPDLEMDRLCHLLQEGIDAQRVSVMVQNWNSSSDWIEASRMPTERSVSIARLRLDRLERMIREENVVNARQIAPPRPVVRHVRMYDGPQ
ncbi:hypothetical protein BJ875DRAFT_455576 [Amylocarpus encephaloides]|uniref:Uncharacterized protein n=1 Tax=Amylocarpus encephaloides TaxID=45428 RepID=A0A9P7YMY4_9HELO|nr:hypothetical protein BJ875DRAFT_455576 [Amylocarpus encephaloides]